MSLANTLHAQTSVPIIPINNSKLNRVWVAESPHTLRRVSQVQSFLKHGPQQAVCFLCPFYFLSCLNVDCPASMFIVVADQLQCQSMRKRQLTSCLARRTPSTTRRNDVMSIIIVFYGLLSLSNNLTFSSAIHQNNAFHKDNAARMRGLPTITPLNSLSDVA